MEVEKCDPVAAMPVHTSRWAGYSRADRLHLDVMDQMDLPGVGCSD